MTRLLTTTTLAFAILLGACAKNTPAPEAPAAADHAAGHEMAADDDSKPLVKNGEAQVGDRTTCPVSGETFVVAADSEKVEHEGKTYYMCCPGCTGKFQADPAKYTSSI